MVMPQVVPTGVVIVLTTGITLNPTLGNFPLVTTEVTQTKLLESHNEVEHLVLVLDGEVLEFLGELRQEVYGVMHSHDPCG
jgi:hypothetical protein